MAALISLGVGLAFVLTPPREIPQIQRESFASFPRDIGPWAGTMQVLDSDIARVLAADDYVNATFIAPGQAAPVNLFSAWYSKQTEGSGIHSPEVCLPVGGWEMYSLSEHQVDFPDTVYGSFMVNRAVIQKGLSKQLVYYWFEQRGKRMTNDYMAKASVVWDSLTMGRSDGALIRVITPILDGESEATAESRLQGFAKLALQKLPRFIPE